VIRPSPAQVGCEWTCWWVAELQGRTGALAPAPAWAVCCRDDASTLTLLLALRQASGDTLAVGHCRHGALASPAQPARPRSPLTRWGKGPCGNELLGCLESSCRPGAGATMGGWRRPTGPAASRAPALTVLLARTLAQQLQAFPSIGFSSFLLIDPSPLVGR